MVSVAEASIFAPSQLCSEVPGDYLALVIDQDRDIESEGLMLLAICRTCFLLWRPNRRVMDASAGR
jgi:hypothetical protein